MPALQAGRRGSIPLSSTNISFKFQVSSLNATAEACLTRNSKLLSGDVAQLDKKSVGLVNRTIRVRLPSSPPSRKDEGMKMPTRLSSSSFRLHPFCGVAKLVRHRTVNAAMRRFESFRHSQIIADCRFPIGVFSTVILLSWKAIGNRKLEIGNWKSTMCWPGARVTERRPFKP